MSSSTTSGINGVWGSSPTNVFAVGDSGMILHYNGSTWSTVTSGTTSNLTAIWGDSSTEIFAVGWDGEILHYNGSAWSRMTSGISGDALLGVCGSASNDVFAVGTGDTILHYNGNIWKRMATGTENCQFYGVWGNSATTVFTVCTGEDWGAGYLKWYSKVLRYDGAAWSEVCRSVAHRLYGVWGSSPTDVFAAGSNGEILYYDGSLWTTLTSGNTYDLPHGLLVGVWGSSSTNVFTVGRGGTILQYNGTAWNQIRDSTTDMLYDIWGSSPADIFAVGDGGVVLHYNGSTWSTMTSGTPYKLRGVWASSASDFFAVGDCGTIIHYNGSTWNQMYSGTTVALFDGVWGSSSGDVFAVGHMILHYDGTAWSTMYEYPGCLFYGVWGSSPSDVFAVGIQGIILHYDGSTWSQMSSGTSADLFEVWGSSPTDVFAVGNEMLHYDGSSWSPIDIGTKDWLMDIWGTSSSDIFAVGGGNAILHYDAAWSLTSVTPNHGRQGESLAVTITGPSLSDIVSVSLESGIAVNSFTRDSPTEITANISIDSSASPGPRRVSVTTSRGTMTKAGGFWVMQALPVITSVRPSHGYQGQHLEVSITGTHLTGAWSLDFGSDVFVSEVTFESDTEIRAHINVSFSATPGVRGITVTTLGGTSNEGAFTVFPDWARPDGQALQGLSSAVAHLREMTLGSVPVQVVTQDELRELLLKNSEDDLIQVATAQDLYVLLDFLEDGQNLYNILIEAYAQGILGFYDPENDELCLVSYTSDFGPLEKLILVHEYAHALQDQHFNLTSLWKKDYNSDISMAVNSLVEGDAMLVTAAYYLNFLSEPERRLIGDLSTEPGREPGADVPMVVQKNMMFPYRYGVEFVGAIFSNGGWEAVNRAYNYPPKSTEQIMHPEKYYRQKDDPRSVILPNIAAALGTGWSELDSDVFGEFGLLIYLEAFLDPSDAAKAAEGWGGDRYAFLKDDAGKELFLLSSVWDSKKDAREFYEACVARAEKKSGEDVGSVLRSKTERRWQSDGYSLYLRQDGASVLLIIAPDETIIDTLLSEVGPDLGGWGEAGESHLWMWVTIGVSAVVILVVSALVVRRVARRA
jgi:hypothetical protein